MGGESFMDKPGLYRGAMQMSHLSTLVILAMTVIIDITSRRKE
jgi:hypothetical protein